MATTPNGFTVLEPGSKDLARLDVHGVPFVVWRPAVPAFRHLTDFLHAVEPVTEPGWDGGYAHRLIRGSTDRWSEHASGTAIDWNASQHPMGVKGAPGWTPDQVRVIRWWLATPVGRLFRWGIDFSRPDGMHFEVRDKATWDRISKRWQK